MTSPVTSDVTSAVTSDVARWTRGVRRLVVFSGAGISTDSGIQDFRGPAGAWTLDPKAPARNTYEAFVADENLRAEYWRSRFDHPAWHAEPNPAHDAVASLTESEVDTVVVTQNTDGLHQRAGAPADRVVELHGTMHTTECVACGERQPTADVLARIGAGEPVPACVACGGALKTASTMFGQTMSPAVYATAMSAMTTCDLVLAVGTSLAVEPAGSMCASAVRAGATLVIVNRDTTPYDGIATALVRDPIGDALPRIAQQLLAATAHAAAHLGDPAADPTHAPDPTRAADPTRVADSALAAVAATVRGTAPVDARVADEVVAATVTPKLLMAILDDAEPDEDRHALAVLARLAVTRPDVQTCLTHLLSVLPGLSPAAVDVALAADHPEPLAQALTALAQSAALPAELLESVPAGTTVLGEFPILLTQSLVDAYEARQSSPAGLRGLARMLVELADRLADLARTDEALVVAQRAVAAADRLGEPAERAGAAAVLGRVTGH